MNGRRLPSFERQRSESLPNVGWKITPKMLSNVIITPMNNGTSVIPPPAALTTSQVVDAVVYRFDYSKVALIISSEYERIAHDIGVKLDRGATFLHGEGSYSHQQTKVVLAAVKKQQVTELKELVTAIDPNAFIIVQEAHQVLGDGFSRYTKESL